MLNRTIIILRYKQPFIDWINAAEPNPKHEVESAYANDDNTAYLVEVEDEEELEEWLEANGKALFEEELNSWFTDPDLWPQDRSPTLLREWCTLEFHSMVVDTGVSPIVDDEADGPA